MVRDAQLLGARVTPYINGRLWDPAADSYKRDRGYDASCRKPDGSLYTEIYPTSKVLNTVTCPSTDIWHRKIIELVDSLQHAVGVNGIYIDQIAAAAPNPVGTRRTATRSGAAISGTTATAGLSARSAHTTCSRTGS